MNPIYESPFYQIRNPTVNTIQSNTKILISFLAPMIRSKLARAYLEENVLKVFLHVGCQVKPMTKMSHLKAHVHNMR